MNALQQLIRTPRAAVQYTNILLTTEDATVGATPKDPIWTYRKTTLYRYRNPKRTHAIPVLLTFALINRPDIFDLRPGNSFVEYLISRGFDVFLLDWGEQGEEDAELGLESFICDQLPWGIRETLRASEQEEISLVGWCIGGTLAAIHAALEPDGAVRNLALLTTPFDTNGTLYKTWVGHEDFDPVVVTEALPSVPGEAIDWANKMMKPVTNYWTTYRKLWDDVLQGTSRQDAYQSMAKWVGNNPPFPGRAYREWLTWMYKENRLIRGRLRLRNRRVDLRRIHQNLLVVTAGADHIAPRAGTIPILDLVSSKDVTHFDRSGGHIGLMAGSKARKEIWPDIAGWLAERSAA